jgi:hypothetical protein
MAGENGSKAASAMAVKVLFIGLPGGMRAGYFALAAV